MRSCFAKSIQHRSSVVLKQKKRCLVLRCFNKALSKAAVNDSVYSAITGENYVIANLPFDHFYHGMLQQHRNNPLPVIDATGITGNVSMKLPADFSNILAMQTALAKYGLTLCEEEPEIDMLLLKQE